jgi:uncharacterized protein YbjT (DUF2867 family)
MARNLDVVGLPDGVEVVRGDLSDPASLHQPLRDVDVVFLMWPFLTSAGADDVLDVIKQHARRVVYLSADGLRPEWEPQWERQVSPIHQFHAELERAVQRSGLEWVFLHPASFTSNNLSWAPQVREGVVRAPFGSQVRALIHEVDIAAVAVHALTHDDLLGTRPVLTGPQALTTGEQV